MKTDKLDQILVGMKFVHLSDDELDGHLDNTLDEVAASRVAAHLDLCLICEQRLILLREEREAAQQVQVTEEDWALVRRLMGKPRPWDRLRDQLLGALTELRAALAGGGFALGMAGANTTGNRSWRLGETSDGLLWRAGLADGMVIIEISTHDLSLTGSQVVLTLETQRATATLKRLSHDTVGAVLRLAEDSLNAGLASLALELVDSEEPNTDAG